MDYSDRIINSHLDIITPIMEGSVILAGDYTKACGRECLTGSDLMYAMRYMAMNHVGEKIGTLFPDEESDEESDEGSDEEYVDEEEEENVFTRYTGDDPLLVKVNESYDLWEQWEPQTPIEHMLKDAVNNST